MSIIFGEIRRDWGRFGEITGALRIKNDCLSFCLTFIYLTFCWSLPSGPPGQLGPGPALVVDIGLLALRGSRNRGSQFLNRRLKNGSETIAATTPYSRTAVLSYGRAQPCSEKKHYLHLSSHLQYFYTKVVIFRKKYFWIKKNLVDVEFCHWDFFIQTGWLLCINLNFLVIVIIRS